MAIGVLKFSKSGRKKLKFILNALNLVVVTIGFGMSGFSLYIFFAIAPVLFSETAEIRFVSASTAIYGTHVVLFWLAGLKISEKCVTQAHKKSTRKLLFLWTCAGTGMIISLIIIAALSRRINRQITRAMKNSLQNGMRNYLKDITWKIFIDQLQYNEECCGVDSYKDWHENSWLSECQVDKGSNAFLELRKGDTFNLPVTPWSCCKLGFPMQCLHDPLQQEPYAHMWKNESAIVTDSINSKGCLHIIKKPIETLIVLFETFAAFLFILQVFIFIAARLLYTSCRNLILLNNPEAISPGWIFGRGDCGYNRGRTLSQIMINVQQPEAKTDSEKPEKTEKSFRTKLKKFTKRKPKNESNSPSSSPDENEHLLNLK